MSTEELWYTNSETLVTITLSDAANGGTYINNATATGVLKTAAGVTVTGGEAITFSYVAGSNGIYEGEIPSTLTLTADAFYTLVVTVAGASKALELHIKRAAGAKTA